MVNCPGPLFEGQIRPMESFSALEILAVHGYNPETPKVKRAAEYLELWREKSIEASKAATWPLEPGDNAEIRP